MKIEIIYLSNTWTRLHIDNVTKKIIIFLNIFNLKKIRKNKYQSCQNLH